MENKKNILKYEEPKMDVILTEKEIFMNPSESSWGDIIVDENKMSL